MGEDSKTAVISSWRLALYSPVTTFLTALRFLTIIPISWKNETDSSCFMASVVWFPLVGLFIGGITATVALMVTPFVPVSLVAVTALFLLSGISGFLHLDGVADSGDGLLSSRPRSQALEIMRDSRSGAMGVIVLVFILLAKYATLSSFSPATLIPILFLMPVAGRTAILISMALLPYARKGDGLGALFYSKERYSIAAASIFFFVVCTIVILPQALYALLIAMAISILVFSRFCFVKLGGATGDTLGAVCELTELAVAVAALSFAGDV